MGRHVKWTDTESFHNLVRHFDAQAAYHAEQGTPFSYPTVTYSSKVKLHGTNAGIQIDPDGEVTAQGRNRVLSEKDSNNGFFQYVDANRPHFASWATAHPMVIYGEWCGPGIQRGTALNQLKRRMFCIFAIQFNAPDGPTLRTEPSKIMGQLPHLLPDCHVLPWQSRGLTVRFGDRAELQRVADEVSFLTNEVERCDPWVAGKFGVEGIGEGLVWYPELPDLSPRGQTTGLLFKTKGEKHRAVKQRQPAQVDPEKAANADEFVDLVLTEARLAQGLAEIGGVAEMRHTAEFMRWIGADINKECGDELNMAGLAWKDVGKRISSRAVKWFKNRSTAL